MKTIKKLKTLYRLLIVAAMLSSGPCYVFAQEEMDDDDEYLSGREEADMYVNSRPRSHENRDAEDGIKVVGTISTIFSITGETPEQVARARSASQNAAQGEEDSTDPPPPPTYPDVPVNNHVLLLMLLQVAYGLYKIRRRHMNRLAVSKVRVI
jgi:hypothetical protein